MSVSKERLFSLVDQAELSDKFRLEFDDSEFIVERSEEVMSNGRKSYGFLLDTRTKTRYLWVIPIETKKERTYVIFIRTGLSPLEQRAAIVHQLVELRLLYERDYSDTRKKQDEAHRTAEQYEAEYISRS